MTRISLRRHYDKSLRKRTKKRLQKEGFYSFSKKRDIFRIRKWAVRQALKPGANKSELAKLLGICRQTLYNWIKRYKEGGWKALKSQSTRPKTIHRILQEHEDLILFLRKCHGLGCEKIAYDTPVSHMTVYRVLLKHKEISPQKKRRRKWRFFQRKHANSLWQIDLKNLVDNIWSISILDDHSRFLVGFQMVLGVPHVEDVASVLEKSIREYGKPREVLTDHGTQFYAVRGNLSTFDMWCVEANIYHILAGVRKPTTIGKVEAWHRILEAEFLQKNIYSDIVTMNQDIVKYVKFYNYDRLHFTYENVIFAGMEKRRKAKFFPYLRFVTHRKQQMVKLLWRRPCHSLSVK